MSGAIEAPALLNTQGAYQLMEQIKAAEGAPLELEMSAVRHVGAQALQILLATKAAWVAADLSFEISNPSADFRQGVLALGVNEDLEIEDSTT